MARTTNYLESADLDVRLSVTGAVKQRTDPVGTTTAVNTDAVNEAIEYASDLVDQYCVPRGYTVADLATSDWAKKRAVDLAVCRYRSRRGDNRSDAEKEACKDALKSLEMVFAGKTPIHDLDRPSGWGRIGVVRILRPRESQIWPVREVEFEKDESVVNDTADDV